MFYPRNRASEFSLSVPRGTWIEQKMDDMMIPLVNREHQSAGWAIDRVHMTSPPIHHMQASKC